MKIPFFSQRKSRDHGDSPAATLPQNPGPVDIILNYHEETKHHYHRYSRSLGYLDWETQPDPFRRFEGARLIPLPVLPQDAAPGYEDLFVPGSVPSASQSMESLSRFFRNSLAISAWKRYGGARWALRVNPSSGNLHPTEGYLLTGDSFAEVPAGVYHYAPKEHGLEQRALFAEGVWKSLAGVLPAGAFLVALTSIHWREAWKYGERAYRYCQHDIGHALAALRMSAAILGWQLLVWEQPADSDVARLLGLNRPADFEEAEDEHPDLIAVVVPSRDPVLPGAELPPEFVERVASSPWSGRANRLSADHVEWQIIDEAARATRKERSPELRLAGTTPGTEASLPVGLPQASAERVVQQRRSCLALDGATSISSEAFYRMMLRAVPGFFSVPFDALEISEMRTPRIHLAVFVHRVTGIPRGLYMVARDAAKVSLLRNSMHDRFLWEKPAQCPEDLDLFLLAAGDFSRTAAGICCGQDIGGDGVFSLGMIAEYEESVRAFGAWFYRRLFWEAGLIGQILYLEAEAAGIRSTGIGCYFDDPMHETLGLKGRRYQSLYHFTVGAPVEDARLTTEPAYER